MIGVKVRNIVLMCVACAMLTSCAGNKQGSGTAIGAVAGGLLGSAFGKGAGKLVAIGIGAVAGGFLGNSIGKSLDEHDRMMADNASKKALEAAPSGQSVAWKNPDTGNYGTVTPTKTYQTNDGRYCREYTQNITVGDKQEKAYGKACGQPDGQWQIVQ